VVDQDDKTQAACRVKFDNEHCFGGFPKMDIRAEPWECLNCKSYNPFSPFEHRCEKCGTYFEEIPESVSG